MAPVSEAKKRANKKWNNANYKRFNIALPKEEAEIIDKYCEVKNISKNSFFREKYGFEILSMDKIKEYQG